MSVNPVLAALVGLVVLDQSLGWAEWLAVTTIVTANAICLLTTVSAGPGPRRAGRCRGRVRS
jgi:inner membrane transporter RhtA